MHESSRRLLGECLNRLAPLRKEPDFDILVVDNAPLDQSTQRTVERFEGVRYVRESRPRLDFARNRAVAESTTDFVAFLDDDVEVDGEWFAGFKEALAEHPDTAAITGLVLPFELASNAPIIFEHHGGFLRSSALMAPASRPIPCIRPAPGYSGRGCNVVLRRDIVLELGGFDETLDTDPSLPGGGAIDIASISALGEFSP